MFDADEWRVLSYCPENVSALDHCPLSRAVRPLRYDNDETLLMAAAAAAEKPRSEERRKEIFYMKINIWNIISGEFN